MQNNSELINRLASYAAYHRDARNVRTHFIGIPLIAIASAALLWPAGFSPMGLPFNVATILTFLIVLYYYQLDWRYGTAMILPMLVVLWAGAFIGSMATLPWLIMSLVIFALGWMQQLLGHHYEGRKPAFIDDLRSIPIGPLFLMAEFGFKFGYRPEIKEAIEDRRKQPRV